MAKSLGYVFLTFFALVIGYAIISAVGGVMSANASFLMPSITTAPGQFAAIGQSGGGLTTVDFDLFAKGGKGYSYITQGYGNTPYSYMYIDHWHNGIDIAANYGASIYSPANGVVVATGDQDNYCPRLAFGKFVVIHDTKNNLILLFAHLGTISVQPGQNILSGDLLATVGSTGDETGPHLHFSIFEPSGFSMAPAHGCGPYPQGHDVDPLNYLGTVYN